MTKQELADLSDARLMLNNTLPDGGVQETFSRILDSWQEKDRKLDCMCAVSQDLLDAATAAVDSYVCKGEKCGTTACPRGYSCNAYELKQAVLRLRACMEGR